MFKLAVYLLLLCESTTSVHGFQSYLDSLNSKKPSSPSVENLKSALPPPPPPPPPPPAIQSPVKASEEGLRSSQPSQPVISNGFTKVANEVSQRSSSNGVKGVYREYIRSRPDDAANSNTEGGTTQSPVKATDEGLRSSQPSQPITTSNGFAKKINSEGSRGESSNGVNEKYLEYMRLRAEAAGISNINAATVHTSIANKARLGSATEAKKDGVSSSESTRTRPTYGVINEVDSGLPMATKANAGNDQSKSAADSLFEHTKNAIGYFSTRAGNEGPLAPGKISSSPLPGNEGPRAPGKISSSPLPGNERLKMQQLKNPFDSTPKQQLKNPFASTPKPYKEVTYSELLRSKPLAFEKNTESAMIPARTGTENPLDLFVTKGQNWVQDAVGDYGLLLKKHARMALTGGVPLNREMAGERLAPTLDTTGMTERIMKSISQDNHVTETDESSTWQAFQDAEANWARLREYIPDPRDELPIPFVTEEGGEGNPKCYAKLHHQKARSLDFDIAVCGGTLGIFFATALQMRGHQVCVMEPGKLQGRDQEWNVSMEDLLRLKALGVISQKDIDAAVQTEFPGCRSGFKNKEVPVKDGYLENGVGYECFTEGVKNIGVSPKILIERVAERFESLGGVIHEGFPLEGVCVIKDIGASLDFGEEYEPVTAHIVIDAMGTNSPITRQQRYGTKPDGVCVVVGTCASGYDPKTNLVGDTMYTNAAIQDKGENGGRMQYFWESFPVGIGRNDKLPGTSDTKTTYMFTYMDAHQRRPTLEALMEDYWRLLPQYQPSIQNPEQDLDVKRVLFAYFPSYKDSPLPSGFHRILAVGDASGMQSPLSLGGFGAMTRHLGRITSAVSEALDANLVAKQDLARINAYSPNLSASWMLQKAMSVRMGQPFVDKRFVNRLLATNFEAMNQMGPQTIKPFLQDVVRFDNLVGTVTKSLVNDPTIVPQLVAWVGLPSLVDWMGHVSMMGMYAALDNYVAPWLRPIGVSALRKDRAKYELNRRLDAWKYGSGNDYDTSKIPKE